MSDTAKQLRLELEDKKASLAEAKIKSDTAEQLCSKLLEGMKASFHESDLERGRKYGDKYLCKFRTLEELWADQARILEDTELSTLGSYCQVLNLLLQRTLGVSDMETFCIGSPGSFLIINNQLVVFVPR